MTKSLAILMLILQLATVGLLTRQYLQDRQRSEDGEYEEDDGPTTIDDLADDISQTRFELKQQVDRMTRMIDGLARDGIGAGNPAAPQDDSIAVVGDPNKLTTAQLVTKVIQLHEMHARYEFDPLQREPIEKERARIEGRAPQSRRRDDRFDRRRTAYDDGHARTVASPRVRGRSDHRTW
jgi:hypothetical protein